jgi:NOL1/NOP2/fmu family ribosome biogenesis protein
MQKADQFSTKTKAKNERVPAAEIKHIRYFLNEADEYFFIKQNEEMIAMPRWLETDFMIIRSALYIKKAGVKLGTLIRNELIPDHELAISTIISRNIQSLEMDRETALQFLRKTEIKLTSPERGWALPTYNKLPLGWIKVLPNRINNYYPKDWRIFNK